MAEERLDRLHRSELFVFLSIVLGRPAKTKNLKTSSNPWRGTEERLDTGHRFEWVVFFVFGLSIALGRPAKTKKHKD